MLGTTSSHCIVNSVIIMANASIKIVQLLMYTSICIHKADFCK